MYRSPSRTSHLAVTDVYYTTLDLLDDYPEEPGMQKDSMGIITGLAVLMCLSARVNAADFNAARFDTIAVMPFQNDTNDASLNWLSMGIPETIMADFNAVAGLVIIERIQLWRIMEEQALQVAGAVSDVSAMEVGQLLGANLLVVGAFQKQGNTVRLTARFVEAESGSVVQTAKVTGRLNDIFELQDKLVSELLAGMSLTTAGTKSFGPVHDLTKSIEAFQCFGQASLFHAQKNYQGAVEQLRRAIDLDPGFAAARERYSELFLSLEADSYREYETISSYSDKEELFSVSMHRAGGISALKGRWYHTNVRKVDDSLSGSESSGRIVEYYDRREDGIYFAGILTDPERGTESLTIYNPAVLLYPFDMEVGQKWSSQSMVKERRSSAGRETGQWQATIVGREELEIDPAEVLDCYVIEYDRWIPGSGAPATVWFAPGIGVVKIVQISTAEKASSSTTQTQMILRAYHFEQ